MLFNVLFLSRPGLIYHLGTEQITILRLSFPTLDTKKHFNFEVICPLGLENYLESSLSNKLVSVPFCVPYNILFRNVLALKLTVKCDLQHKWQTL